MKIKHIRCGICHDWHVWGTACHSCGACRVVLSGKVSYYNRISLREMVRGFHAPLHEMVRQDWQWLSEDRENIKEVKA